MTSPTDPDGPAQPRVVLARSASTRRFVEDPRPTTRGWSHLAAAVVSLPGAAFWTAITEPGRARLAVAAFAWGVAAMFTGSALLHLRRWSEAATERLVRVDHTGIYLAIGGTGLALALVDELFHLLVIVAVIAHAVMIADLVAR